jgi:ribonuclease HI
MNNFEIYFDGACEPKNPGGHMGYGYLIYQNGELLNNNSFYEDKHPNNTNNVAEYKACIEALHALKEYINLNNLEQSVVNVYGDSMLVVKQMKGRWKIKNGAYVLFAQRTKELVKEF